MMHRAWIGDGGVIGVGGWVACWLAGWVGGVVGVTHAAAARRRGAAAEINTSELSSP